MSRRLCVIFDVDGTLCNVRTVRHLLPNFDAFHIESTSCPPVFRTRVLWVLCGLLRIRRVVVTARQAKYYQYTLWWLLLNGFNPDDMYMRRWNDQRQDAVVKEEILEIIRSRYRPILAVDDNPNVIEVWRRNGIRTITIPGFTP